MNISSSAKCPKCGTLVASVVAGHTEIRIPASTTAWHGITYACPSCQTLLGVEMDPVALKNDIVADLFAKLRS